MGHGILFTKNTCKVEEKWRQEGGLEEEREWQLLEELQLWAQYTRSHVYIELILTKLTMNYIELYWLWTWFGSESLGCYMLTVDRSAGKLLKSTSKAHKVLYVANWIYIKKRKKKKMSADFKTNVWQWLHCWNATEALHNLGAALGKVSGPQRRGECQHPREGQKNQGEFQPGRLAVILARLFSSATADL